MNDSDGGYTARHHRRAMSLRDVVMSFAIVSTTACSAGHKATPQPFALPQIYVQARNAGSEEITLYALSDGRRHRVGSVNGGGTTRYTLEWRTSQMLQFELHRSAGSSCYTRKLRVEPGEGVEVWMEARAVVQSDGTRRECDMRRAR